MRVVLAACVAAVCANAPVQARELLKTGPIWEKSILVKPGQERGCFFATVSRRERGDYLVSTLNLYFRREPEDKRYSTAHFYLDSYNRRLWGKDDFVVEGDTGDVLEACVAPGRYALSHFSFYAGSTIVTPTVFQPIAFEVEAGRDYYLGNFHMEPGAERRVLVRDRLQRDAALIRQHAKRAPTTELLATVLRGKHGDGGLMPTRLDVLRRILDGSLNEGLVPGTPLPPPPSAQYRRPAAVSAPPAAPRAAAPTTPTAPPAPGSQWWRRQVPAPTDAGAAPPAPSPAATPTPPDATGAASGGRSSST